MLAGADGPKLSPEEVKRGQLADQLVDAGLGSRALCLTALQLKRDDTDQAAEWLMGPEAAAFMQGGGLEKGVGEANPR